MKPIILSLPARLIASLLALGVTIAPLALARSDSAAPLIEGKDRPILLQRMVVTATALP